MRSVLFLAAALLVQTVIAQQAGFKKTLTDIGVSRNGNNAMVLQPGGKIVTGGFASNGQVTKFSFLRYDSVGNIDKSFGKNGVDTFSNILPAGYKFGTITSMGLQSNGRIVAGGTAYYQVGGSQLYSDLFLIGLLPNGKIDSTFGTNGVAIMDLGYSEQATSICVQPDGKILIAGTQFSGFYYRFLLARFLSNGKPDQQFKISRSSYNGRDDEAYDIALQSDGKIVVVGTTYVSNQGYTVLLTRFLNDGSADYSFGTSGKTVTPVSYFSDFGYEVAVQKDDRIIVAGTTQADNASKTNILAIRYSAGGKVDSSFAQNGVLIEDVFGEDEKPKSLLVQPSGKILISGYAAQHGVKSFLTLRLNNNGKLDGSFGNQGIAVATANNQGDEANDMVVKESGAITLAGYSVKDGSNVFSAVQFTAKGIKDAAFGNKGIQLTSISTSIDKATRMVRLPWNNTLLVSGTGGYKWALANYTTALTLNTSFGQNGKQTFTWGDEYSKSTPAIAIDSAWRKIYLAGVTDQDGFIILRLNSNGSIDSNFAQNGVLKLEVYSFEGALAITNDHKIVFGGSVYSNDDYKAYPFVARYLSGGRPDLSFAPKGVFARLPIFPYSIALDKSRILVAGIKIVNEHDEKGIAVAAVKNSKAAMDSSFGVNGLTVKKVPNGSALQSMHYGIAVDVLGRIYVNGGVIDHSSFVNRMSITRFLANGMSDNSFGDSGIMLSDSKDFGYEHVVNEGLALNNGSNGAFPIITAGYKGEESYSTSFLAAAYTESGALDSLPNTSNGYMDTLFYKRASEASYAVLAYDGYAYFTGIGGAQNEPDFMLVKFALPVRNKVNALPAQPVIYLTANPNPAHSFINAKYELTEDASVQFRLVAVNSGTVYPLQQQTLKKGTYQTRLPVNGVPKGIYALQLVTGRGQASVKLWVE